MIDDKRDPMLFGKASKQAKYRDGVMRLVRETISEDRAARRNRPPQLDYPATIIGATGLTEGLNSSL